MDPRANVRRSLFRKIVAFDYARILSRLRSRHAARSWKTRGRQCFITLLSGAVNDPTVSSCGNLTNAQLAGIRSRVDSLVREFDRFEATNNNSAASSTCQDILMDMLEQIHELGNNTRLGAALQTSAVIDPSLKHSLPETARKLGRYHSLSCDLIDAARSPRYTIFSRISIKVLVQPDIGCQSLTQNFASFEEALQNVTRSPPPKRSRSKKTAPKDPMGRLAPARLKFQSRPPGCITARKVHAEVQLLFFYESNLEVRHPRVLCSSKSACYLCHLFITIHGEFEVPRTHGRLYEKWILPEGPSDGTSHGILHTLIVRFNKELESKILWTLNHGKLLSIHPNESVLPIHERWSSSSTLSKAYPHQVSAGSFLYKQPDISERLEDCLRMTTACEPGSSQSTLKALPPDAEPLSAEANTQVAQFIDEGLQPDAAPTEAVTISKRLIRGVWTCHKFVDPHHILNVQSDAVHLHLSWNSVESNAVGESNTSYRSCWVRVKWLLSDAQLDHKNGDLTPVDLEAASEDTDLKVECGAALSPKVLLLKKRKDLILVKYTFDDPPWEPVRVDAGGA